MNKTILNFLEKQNIPINIAEDGYTYVIKDAQDINHVVAKNRLSFDQLVKTQVSIADIIGYNYKTMADYSRSLFENASHLFDENGSDYHKRSLSMLTYSTEEVVEKLLPSFRNEPMHILEIEQGTYVIGNNGMHRYHVLRAHYLKELSTINPKNTQAIEALRQKYMVPATVQKTDFTATYITYFLKYLANQNSETLTIEPEYTQDAGFTGNISMSSSFSPEENIVFTKEQYLSMFQQAVGEFLQINANDTRKIERFQDTILHLYENLPSFQEFYQQYMQSLNLNIPEISNTNGDLKWK